MLIQKKKSFIRSKISLNHHFYDFSINISKKKLLDFLILLGLTYLRLTVRTISIFYEENLISLVSFQIHENNFKKINHFLAFSYRLKKQLIIGENQCQKGSINFTIFFNFYIFIKYLFLGSTDLIHSAYFSFSLQEIMSDLINYQNNPVILDFLLYIKKLFTINDNLQNFFERKLNFLSENGDFSIIFSQIILLFVSELKFLLFNLDHHFFVY